MTVTRLSFLLDQIPLCDGHWHDEILLKWLKKNWALITTGLTSNSILRHVRWKKGEGSDPLLIMQQLTLDTPSPETWTHFGSDILERKWLLPTLDVIVPIKNEDMGIVFRGYLSFDIDVDVIEKTLRVITRSLIDLMIKVPHGSPMGSSHLKLSISTLQSAVHCICKLS